LKILVVDNAWALNVDYVRNLVAEGFFICSAAQWFESFVPAWEDQEEYGAVVIDIDSPGMRNIEIIKVVDVNRSDRFSVVFNSALSNVDCRVRASCAIAFVPKKTIAESILSTLLFLPGCESVA